MCFILGSPLKFQAICGEATELVRRSHRNDNKIHGIVCISCVKITEVIDLHQ